MPRKRVEHIKESLETLRALEEQYKGTPEEERASFLRILKENPSFKHADVARILGRSEPTVQRWWRAYKQGGLEATLDVRKSGGGKPARLNDAGMEALRRKVLEEGIRDTRQLQEWLKSEFGIDYSRAGVQYLLRARIDGNSQAQHEEESPLNIDDVEQSDVQDFPESDQEMPTGLPTPNGPANPSGLIIPRDILAFLNAIPVTHDIREWIQSFRETFKTLLADVDRVSIIINVDCDLRDPENYRREMVIAQLSRGDEKAKNTVVVVKNEGGDNRSKIYLESLASQKFPLEQYHKPLAIDYFLSGKAYIGTMFFWRDRTSPEISQRTIDTIAALEPFIIFLFSDVVARNKYSDTVNKSFNESLAYILGNAGLTDRERQVVILQLFGHTYDQIADKLYISIDTVRKYVTSIYRKTGTHSYTELFAKYFTPSLGF